MNIVSAVANLQETADYYKQLSDELAILDHVRDERDSADVSVEDERNDLVRRKDCHGGGRV